MVPPLVEDMIDVSLQVQPNGIDLTIRDVSLYASPGRVDLSNSGRSLSNLTPVPFDENGFIHLTRGAYLVTFNEVVHLPPDVAALGRTRSSLLRSGVALHTAVWDAGYAGRSQSLMTVYNSHGFDLSRNARIMQLVFLRLESPVSEGYDGAFLNENT